MRKFHSGCFLVASFLCVSTGSLADKLFGDPAPIPLELIERLKQEGSPETVKSLSSRTAAIDARGQAIGQMVSVSGFLRSNAAADLKALRVQMKELIAEHKRVVGTGVSFRSNVDGRVREQPLNPALVAPLEKRIAVLKDIVFGLENADMSTEQASQLYKSRVSSQTTRQVYYDPKPQLDIDLQPNWGPRKGSVAIDAELAREQEELAAGRAVPVVSPVSRK